MRWSPSNYFAQTFTTSAHAGRFLGCQRRRSVTCCLLLLRDEAGVRVRVGK